MMNLPIILRVTIVYFILLKYILNLFLLIFFVYFVAICKQIRWPANVHSFRKSDIYSKSFGLNFFGLEYRYCFNLHCLNKLASVGVASLYQLGSQTGNLICYSTLGITFIPKILIHYEHLRNLQVID